MPSVWRIAIHLVDETSYSGFFRGNKSLETLRFIKDLSENAQMVLGNHDFHLLACALGDKPSINGGLLYLKYCRQFELKVSRISVSCSHKRGE
jgi:hypothetical protein